MKFMVKREDLMEGVGKTLGIADRRAIPMPILNNVLIKTDNGRLKIVATDLKVALITRMSAEVERPGEITVPTKKLYEMLRETQGEKVYLEVNEQHYLTLNARSATYRVRGLPSDDYPAVAEMEDAPLYSVAAELLVKMIRRTLLATSTDETKVHLNGVFLETEDSVNGPRLKMTATDGHRLAVAYGQPGEHGGLLIEKGVIIPRKGLVEVRKLLEEEGGGSNVAIGLEGGMFIVKTNHSVLKVSLIDEDYPDYRRVIPSDKGVYLRLDREVFLHALRRMGVMASERNQGVIMTLGGGRIVMNSTDSEVGEAHDELTVAYDGEEIRVAYNVHYLIQPLEVMDTPEVVMELRLGMRPAMLRPVGMEDYVYLIMPIRI